MTCDFDLRFVACDKIVAIISAARNRLLPVQNAVQERDHHFVQLAEQGHQLANAQLFRVRADGTAGNSTRPRTAGRRSPP